MHAAGAAGAAGRGGADGVGEAAGTGTVVGSVPKTAQAGSRPHSARAAPASEAASRRRPTRARSPVLLEPGRDAPAAGPRRPRAPARKVSRQPEHQAGLVARGGRRPRRCPCSRRTRPPPRRRARRRRSRSRVRSPRRAARRRPTPRRRPGRGSWCAPRAYASHSPVKTEASRILRQPPGDLLAGGAPGVLVRLPRPAGDQREALRGLGQVALHPRRAGVADVVEGAARAR